MQTILSIDDAQHALQQMYRDAASTPSVDAAMLVRIRDAACAELDAAHAQRASVRYQAIVRAAQRALHYATLTASQQARASAALRITALRFHAFKHATPEV